MDRLCASLLFLFVAFSGILAQDAEDACGSSPCSNNGTCTATDGGFTCECAPERIGRTCDLRHVTGGFTIYEEFIEEYIMTQSFQYRTLTDQIKAAVNGVFDDTVDGANTNVYEVLLSPDNNNNVSVSFYAALAGFVTEADIELLLAALMESAEDGTLLTDKTVGLVYIGPNPYIRLECQSDSCMNDGICLETERDFECACQPEWAGQVCGERNLRGYFVLEQRYTDEYEDEESELYRSLRQQVKEGVEPKLDENVEANSNVYAVSFSETDNSNTAVSFLASVSSDVTELNILSMRLSLVLGVADTSLIPNITVDATSPITLELNTQSYCENITCSERGVCVEGPFGYSCLCSPVATGRHCEQDVCFGGQMWTDCGSACNRTCEDPDPTCIRLCVPKCECPPEAPIQLHQPGSPFPRCGERDSCPGLCELGEPFTGDSGEIVSCGEGSDPETCPDGYECTTGTADRVCCPRHRETSTRGTGRPTHDPTRPTGRPTPPPPDSASSLKAVIWIITPILFLLM